MKNILVDSCILFSFFDPADSYYKKGTYLYDNFIKKDTIRSQYRICIPWPVTYEIMNTRFVNNARCFDMFFKFIKDFNVNLIDDKKYRINLSNFIFIEYFNFSKKRKVSLVDYIIRKMVEDKSYRFDYLLTYNLRDFIDLERNGKISIFPKDINNLYLMENNFF